MKRYLNLLLLAAMLLSFSACSQIDAGEEGVVTRMPWFAGHGGVDSEPLTTGLTWVALSTKVDKYDVKPMQYTETFDDLITSDNNPVDFNAYIELQIIQGKSPVVHEKFGKEWYERKVKEEFRTSMRALAKKETMFKMTSDPGVLDEIGVSAKSTMAAYIEKQKIPVLVNRVTIGKVSPPQEVLDETMRTAAQKQRELTEDARAKSELNRKKAEENKALADNAYRQNFGMSVDQYLQLRALEIEKEKLDIVRNKENVTIILNSGGAMPMFSAAPRTAAK